MKKNSAVSRKLMNELVEQGHCAPHHNNNIRHSLASRDYRLIRHIYDKVNLQIIYKIKFITQPVSHSSTPHANECHSRIAVLSLLVVTVVQYSTQYYVHSSGSAPTPWFTIVSVFSSSNCNHNCSSAPCYKSVPCGIATVQCNRRAQTLWLRQLLRPCLQEHSTL